MMTQYNEFFTLIEQIKSNTAQYLGEATLECLRAFLKGYYKGQGRERELSEVEQSFSQWYSEYHRLSPEVDVWRHVLYLSIDRFDAIDKYWIWLSEFKTHLTDRSYCTCGVCKKDSDVDFDEDAEVIELTHSAENDKLDELPCSVSAQVAQSLG